MMAVEGPYLAAVIARLPEPTVNLAAFGVAFAVAVIIEAPVIMLLSASTALVEDRESYAALRRFGYRLCAALTVVQLAVLAPPVFDPLFRGLLALPDDVARLAHQGLACLLPWPAAVGYRRFRQGLLIRSGLTRRVAACTGVRLATMSLTALAAWRLLPSGGATVGAAALSAGVVVEAAVTRIVSAQAVRQVRGRARAADRLDEPTLRFGGLVRFYVPLALTSVLALAIPPLTTFFMGQSRRALESLAVLPVVHGVTFVFRAIGLSYLEVVVALIGDRCEQFGRIRNFAAGLAACTVAGLSAIAFTRLGMIWLEGVAGLSPALAQFALPPIRILSVFPALSVLLSLQRGTLVHARRTPPITRATLLELTTVGVVLTIGVHVLDLVGVTAAAVAILSGRLVGNSWLTPPWIAALRAGRRRG